MAHATTCQPGLAWNVVINMCDWEANVDCDINRFVVGELLEASHVCSYQFLKVSLRLRITLPSFFKDSQAHSINLFDEFLKKEHTSSD